MLTKSIDMSGAKSVVRSLFDYIFSFGTLMTLAAIFLIYILIAGGEKDAQQKELRRQATEICYNRGQVLVSTDAGERCVAPAALSVIR